MVTESDRRGRSSRSGNGSGTTSRLYFVILWTVLSTFNFGFGTSELNPLQNVLSCPSASSLRSSSLPSCIEMISAQFGYVTAGFTVGGFLASLTISPLKGRFSILQRSRNVLLMAAVWNLLGGLIQMMAASWPILALGRFFMGLGSGIALAVVPPYLNNISPPHLKGSIGVINQLSIVIGILSAQALGVSPLGASPNSPSLFERNLGLDQAPWRFVPLISAAFPLIQILLSPLALNPPSDLQGEEKEKVERQLWGSNPDGESEQGEQEALLAEDEADADTQGSDGSSSNTSSSVLSITDLLKVVSRPKSSSNLETSSKEHSEIRKGTLVIIFSQMAQQLSGVNGVFYFSTGILSDVFKGGDSSGAGGDKIARFIGLGITFVNFLMTFPPIYLINESLLGRKRLLQISSASMAISSLALAFALLFGQSILAAVSIVVFVAGFSLGLGPIPFLILPELVPKRAVAAASSLGFSLNWLSNITIASLFLPLKNSFAKFDDSNGGSIFYVFVVINSLTFIGISRFYSYKA